MSLLGIERLKYNKKKYSILACLSIVGFSFVYFILQLFGFMMNNKSDNIDDGFLSLLMIFIVIFIICIYMSISAVMYIFYKMSKNEIHILNTIGARAKTIKKIFMEELLILSIIITLSSSIIGTIIINVFASYYESGYKFSLPMFLVFLLLSNSIFISIGVIQIRKIFGELKIIQKNKKVRAKKFRNKKSVAGKKKSSIYAEFIVGIVFILISSSMEDQTVEVITLLIGIMILVNPVLVLIIQILEYIFEKVGLTFVAVSLNQVKFNFKKIKSLIKNFSISIALIILMFTLYNSITESGIVYSRDNMKFTSLIQLDDIKSKESFEENENTFKALSLKGDYKKKEDTLVTGINKNYTKFETLDFAFGNIEDLENHNKEVNCIIPELMRITYDLKINDTFKVKILDEFVEFKIVGTIYTYNYNQIYVNEKQLGGKKLGQAGLINTIYVKDNNNKILNDLNNQQGVTYTSISRDKLIDEYKDSILNGTEMIETFLYVYLVVSVFLIINMLIMSLEEKRRYNYVFEKLGVRKFKIILMNIMETVVIAVIGMIIGIILGVFLYNGLPNVVKDMYGLRMNVFVPTGLLLVISTVTEFVIIIVALVLSIFSNNSESLKLSGGEE